MEMVEKATMDKFENLLGVVLVATCSLFNDDRRDITAIEKFSIDHFVYDSDCDVVGKQ